MSVQWRDKGYSLWNVLFSNRQKYKEQNFGEVSPIAGFNKQVHNMSQGFRDGASYFSYSSSFSYSNYSAMRAHCPREGICMAFVFSVPICRNIRSSVAHLGFWIERYLLKWENYNYYIIFPQNPKMKKWTEKGAEFILFSPGKLDYWLWAIWATLVHFFIFFLKGQLKYTGTGREMTKMPQCSTNSPVHFFATLLNVYSATGDCRRLCHSTASFNKVNF